MEKYEKRLDEEQWGELYNKEQAEQVINGILTEQVFCWTEELLKISAEGDKMCEVVCGSGQSAAYLQRHGRKVTALDFSKECVELVNGIRCFADSFYPICRLPAIFILSISRCLFHVCLFESF